MKTSRRRLAKTPTAEMVHVIDIHNVTDYNLQEKLEDGAAEENGSYTFDRSRSSYTFWFYKLDEAERFLLFVKSLGIKVWD